MLVRVLNLHRDQKPLARTGERWKIPESHRILPIEGSANIPVVHVYIDLHVLLTNNFEHRVLRIEPINSAVQKCASRSTQFAS